MLPANAFKYRKYLYNTVCTFLKQVDEQVSLTRCSVRPICLESVQKMYQPTLVPFPVKVQCHKRFKREVFSFPADPGTKVTLYLYFSF
jgi:hypothetical protein